MPVVPGPYQSKNIYSPAFTEHLLSGPGATKLVSDSLLHSRIYFSTGIYFVVQSNMCEASEPDGLGLNSGPRIEYLLNLGRYSSVPQFPLGNGSDNSTSGNTDDRPALKAATFLCCSMELQLPRIFIPFLIPGLGLVG